ncbi:EscE/YscE/SsaE family type III secretion system needle protein co-chaperone [Vibrio sp. S4M6]|uniref:EscE/YscE/SsaE family type III secretion system needle protein co-chaperone n=1 Tax=Vibrio sinus TaxID=2946865 RepID=UPI00202AADBB|nr:EscE/YscE/SsaE family type III secretion system needle protein co-chaperone [Vibrio sinus]MCL9783829.1 EscE/YscE/SsaE family type III secretion system needle protein co-chaperone [Vibrio sinus]
MASITQLEDKLKADDSGSYRQTLLSFLDEHIIRLEACCRKGSEPQVYEKHQAQIYACKTSKQVITTLWRRYHG